MHTADQRLPAATARTAGSRSPPRAEFSTEPLAPSDDVAQHPGQFSRHILPHQLALHVDEHLNLGALSDTAVLTLTREMLGAPADPELVSWRHRCASGWLVTC